MRRVLLPEPIHLKIKSEYLPHLEAMVTTEPIGLFYLDNTDLEETFIPLIDKYIGEGWRFERVWGHYMKRGGDRPDHTHDGTTMIYYLSIPEGDCGTLVVGQTAYLPVEGTLTVIEPGAHHLITPNNTDEIRFVIAAEMITDENLRKLEVPCN